LPPWFFNCIVFPSPLLSPFFTNITVAEVFSGFPVSNQSPQTAHDLLQKLPPFLNFAPDRRRLLNSTAIARGREVAPPSLLSPFPIVPFFLPPLDRRPPIAFAVIEPWNRTANPVSPPFCQFRFIILSMSLPLDFRVAIVEFINKQPGRIDAFSPIFPGSFLSPSPPIFPGRETPFAVAPL